MAIANKVAETASLMLHYSPVMSITIIFSVSEDKQNKYKS